MCALQDDVKSHRAVCPYLLTYQYQAGKCVGSTLTRLVSRRESDISPQKKKKKDLIDFKLQSAPANASNEKKGKERI